MALDTIGLRAVLEGGAAYIAQLGAAERAERNLAARTAEVSTSSAAMSKSVSESEQALVRKQRAAENLESAMKKLNLVLGVGFIAAAGYAIKLAADFEKQIDQIGAVAGATDEEMKQLGDTAKQIGADTAFSASEAAAAMEELAAGGRSVADIIGGEARAAVDLAAAGNYELADSARTIATAMDVWKASQLEANDVVNRLAAAANESRFGVEDMSAAIAQGGGAAATAGVSFQDFATSIAATASSFSSGSDAGTSFKTFVINLTGSSNEAKDAIKSLGLEFFTAQGEMKPMSEIVQQLHDKLGPLSEEMQTVYLKQIFGNDAFRTAAGLMKLTGDEFAAMSDRMGKTDASEIAAQRMSNLNGKIEALKGSLETLGISLGEKALPALTQAADVSTQLVNKFGELDGSTQAAVLGFTALSVAVGKFNPKAGLTIGLIGAIATLLDALVKDATGTGIFERMMEDFDDDTAERVKLRLEEIRKELSDPNFAGEALPVLKQRLSDVVGEENRLLDAIRSIKENTPGNILSEEDSALIEGYNERLINLTTDFRAYSVELMNNGATTAQLATIYAGLDDRNKSIFDSITHVTEAVATQESQYANAGGILSEYELSLALLNQTYEATAPAIQSTISPIQTWIASLGEVENITEAVKDAIDGMIASFADLNPAVAGLKAENAFLVEEMDDLLAKGDEMTQQDKDRVAVIKDLVAANDAQIAGYESNQKALEGARQALEIYIGSAGLGAVLSKLQELKVPQEDQIALLGDTAGAYKLLSDDRLPEAVAAFEDVKEGLDPAVWAPLADAIGPDLVEAIDKGVTDPVQKKMLYDAVAALVGDSLAGGQEAAARSFEIGLMIANGLADGIRAGIDEATAAARALAGATTAELDSNFVVRSPSKWAIDLGHKIVEGLVIGIEEQTNSSLYRIRQAIEGIKKQIELETDRIKIAQYKEVMDALYDSAVRIALGSAVARDLDALLSEGGGRSLSAALKEDPALLIPIIQAVLRKHPEGVGDLNADTLNKAYEEASKKMFPGGRHPDLAWAVAPEFDPSQIDENVSQGFYKSEFEKARDAFGATAVGTFGVGGEEAQAWIAAANKQAGVTSTPGPGAVMWGQSKLGRYYVNPNTLEITPVPEGAFDPSTGLWFWDNAWQNNPPGVKDTSPMRGEFIDGTYYGDDYYGDLVKLGGEPGGGFAGGYLGGVQKAQAAAARASMASIERFMDENREAFTSGNIFDGSLMSLLFNKPIVSTGSFAGSGGAAQIIFDLTNAQLGSNTHEVGEEFERRVRSVLSEESGRSAFLAGVSAPLRRREV